MQRNTIMAIVLAACMLMAVPAMATTVGAQTADDDSTAEFTFDATLTNETVTVSVASNDTAVENATVAVDGTEVGTTDADGTLQFDLETRSTVEIGVTVDGATQTTTYDLVDGELIAQDDSEDDTTDPAFEFDSTLDNETVTVSVASNDTAVENATVALDGTEVGTTDANGTAQFDLTNQSTVEIAVTVDGETLTTTYDVVEGELVAQDDSENGVEADFEFDSTLDNETVTVSVASNDTAVENATVAANGTEVGTTDADGTVQFDLENRSTVEIAVTVDGTTLTTTYDVTDGELSAQENTTDEQQGPSGDVPDEAAEQVSTIQRLISAFLNGEYDKLGPIVSEAAGNSGGNAPDEAGNGSGNAPDEAGNGQGNAPEQAGNGQGNAPEQAGNGSGNAPDQAGNGPDNAGNGNDNAGSDRGGSGNNQNNGGSNSGGSNSGGSNSGGSNSGGSGADNGNGQGQQGR